MYASLLPRAPDLSFDAFGRRLSAAAPATARDALTRAFASRGITADGCVPLRDLVPAQSVTTNGGGYVAPGLRRLPNGIRGTIAPVVVQLRVSVPPGARRVRLRFSAAASAVPLLAPEPATAFAPRLIARWDAPLSFTVAAGVLGDDAQARATATRDGASYEAALDVDAPTSPRTLYAEVVNAGDGDGVYDAITVAFEDANATSSPAPPPAQLDASGEGATPVTAARRRRMRRCLSSR